MTVYVIEGDMRTVLPQLAPGAVHAIVTDPPYGLEFMGREWDAPWQVASKSALFGDRKTKTPGWSTTRNPTCRECGGRLRGAKRCACAVPRWDEAPNATRLRQMRGFQDWFQECAELMFAILPPGGHLLAFGGTRTYHRMACAIEDAGFEIRDTIAWLYGSGFPKSLNVSKAIDKAAGAEREVISAAAPVKRMIPGADQHKQGWEKNNGRVYVPTETAPATDAARQWDGWGTALKPALEPIVLARKPLDGTVAANIQAHGTGALNIDGCRVASEPLPVHEPTGRCGAVYGAGLEGSRRTGDTRIGRWPANVVHDGSDEVVAAFPQQTSGGTPPSRPPRKTRHTYGAFAGQENPNGIGSTAGSAARFFYSAKADADDRLGSKHPTVKPVDLMRWLVRLVTPPGGTVLDPFAGSGTTGMACMAEGFDCILVEREAEYVADIRRRIAHVTGADTPLFDAP